MAMWPLVALAAAGYFFWLRSKTAPEEAASKGSEPTPTSSPNVVVKDGVQYAKPLTPEQRKNLEILLAGYKPSDPSPLNDGPLKGGAVILFSEASASSEANIEAAAAAYVRAATMVGAKDAADAKMVMAVEQIDAIALGKPPVEVRFYVVRAALALEACKAPSAYAIIS